MSNYARKLHGGQDEDTDMNRSIGELDSDRSMSDRLTGMSARDKQALAAFENGFVRHQKNRQARKLAWQAQKRKEAHRRKANLDRLKAAQRNEKYEEKIVNATYTHISARQLAGKVHNTMKYLHESTPAYRDDLVEEVYTDLENSNNGTTTRDRIANTGNGFVIVGDQYTFELILQHEKQHGYPSSLRGGADDQRYHTAREPGKTLSILKPINNNRGQPEHETVNLKYGLPLARKSSVIAYKQATYISPNPAEQVGDRTGIQHLAALMKDLNMYTQQVQDIAKENYLEQKYVGLKLKELTPDELKEQAKTIAFEILGPKSFFTMKGGEACDTSEWTAMGTPKKPTRPDLSVSSRALEDNTWDDYSLPVQLKTQKHGREVNHAFCAHPAEYELDGQGRKQNMLERRHPEVYHHLDDITKVKKKDDAKVGGKQLHDADIMRDMAFCGVASGKANKAECTSDIKRSYPLTADEKARSSRCRYNEDRTACEPKWMTDKTSPLYQLYYGEGKYSGKKGYAQTEMELNQEVLKREERTNRKITNPDEETMHKIKQTRWDTRLYDQAKMERLYREVGSKRRMEGGSETDGGSVKSSEYLDSMSSLFSITSQ